MDQFVVKLAKALGYNKIERLSQRFQEDNYLLRIALQSSTNNPSAIIFLPNAVYEITPFSLKVHLFYTRGDFPPVNFIMSHPSLDEKFLRRLFTGIELVIYKLCHVELESNQRGYYFESEKTVARLNKLRGIISVEDWTSFKSTFDEIWSVRDSFSHSFMDIRDIEYFGEKLAACFGRSYLGEQVSSARKWGARLFMEDVETIFYPIASRFHSCQFHQIDTEKFFKLCDDLLKKRSLNS